MLFISSTKLSSALSRFIKASIPSRRRVFFDSPGLLEQSQHWGGLVIWTIAAGTTAGLFWAFLGRVDQTVMAGGTLQPLSGKMTVSSPSGGIVRQLFVSDGDIVDKGDVLIVVESEGTKARLQSTEKQLALYLYENQLFNLLLDLFFFLFCFFFLTFHPKLFKQFSRLYPSYKLFSSF